jgi:hypothetical protein
MVLGLMSGGLKSPAPPRLLAHWSLDGIAEEAISSSRHFGEHIAG